MPRAFPIDGWSSRTRIDDVHDCIDSVSVVADLEGPALGHSPYKVVTEACFPGFRTTIAQAGNMIDWRIVDFTEVIHEHLDTERR